MWVPMPNSYIGSYIRSYTGSNVGSYVAYDNNFSENHVSFYTL